MKANTNLFIKNYAQAKGVCLWEVAMKLGISEPTLYRKLRVEFDEETKSKVISIIDSIVAERTF